MIFMTHGRRGGDTVSDKKKQRAQDAAKGGASSSAATTLAGKLVEGVRAFLLAKATLCPLVVAIENRSSGGGEAAFARLVIARLIAGGEAAASFTAPRDGALGASALWVAMAHAAERAMRSRYTTGQLLQLDARLEMERCGGGFGARMSALAYSLSGLVRRTPHASRMMSLCKASGGGEDCLLQEFARLVENFLPDYSVGGRLFLLVEDFDKCAQATTDKLLRCLELLRQEDMPVVFLLPLDRPRAALTLAEERGGEASGDASAAALVKGWDLLESLIQVVFVIPGAAQAELAGADSAAPQPPRRGAKPPPTREQVYLRNSEVEFRHVLSRMAFALDSNADLFESCVMRLRLQAVVDFAAGIDVSAPDARSAMPLPQLAKLVLLQMRWPILYSAMQSDDELRRSVAGWSENAAMAPTLKLPRRHVLQQMLQFMPQDAKDDQWRLNPDLISKFVAAMPALCSNAELAARGGDTAQPTARLPTSTKVAISGGEDEFGNWCDITFPARDGDGDGVVQRFRWIPPGEFVMGSPENEPGRFSNEGPSHLVIITEGFWLADTACSQQLWATQLDKNPSRFTEDDQLPVENLAWSHAENFVNRLNENASLRGWRFAMPTEAQWEYACRAGSQEAFWWGMDLPPGYANYDGQRPLADSAKDVRREATTPVKQFQPNPWGLWQMHGNVWEWCADAARFYVQEAIMDPQGASHEERTRALRGGSWFHEGRSLRSAARNEDWLGSPLYGLRLALKPQEFSVTPTKRTVVRRRKERPAKG